jgi:hypothetical protein
MKIRGPDFPVMAGEDPPSTTLRLTARKDVDGLSESVPGRVGACPCEGGGPTRGTTMTVWWQTAGYTYEWFAFPQRQVRTHPR